MLAERSSGTGRAASRLARWGLVLVAILGAITVVACSDNDSGAEKVAPATVEEIEGSDISQVTLVQEAIVRLGLRIEEVGESTGSINQVPYSAVIYDLTGETWVYVSPEPSVFVREQVTIDYIEAGVAVLLKGPAAGSQVVVIGAAELYGAESGVGK